MASRSKSAAPPKTKRQGEKKPYLLGGLVAIAVIAALGIIGYLIWLDLRPVPLLGEEVPISGFRHIDPGQKATNFVSDPPTSGDHYAQPAEAGFYEEAPADEYLVHNLEHGYVVVYFSCAKLSQAECDQLKSDLKEAMAAAGVASNTRTPKIIVVPRDSMKNLITYTSWGRLYRVNAFNRSEFLQYVEQNRNMAPEPNAP